MTVTNVVGPIMLYVDRFLVAAFASMAAVAYYTTAYEVVMKLAIIPDSIAGALFPAFSISLVQARGRAAKMFDRGVSYIFLTVFPITLIIVTFASECLEIWLGHEFAQNCTTVLRWLAVGVFVNSLARIPFVMIQAEGRPDLSAKLHLIELPIYLVTLWWLVSWRGIEGAAIAWFLRASVDTTGLFALAYWFLPAARPSIRRLSAMLGAALLVLGLHGVITDVLLKAAVLPVTLGVFAVFTWCFILAAEERQLLKTKLGIPSPLGG